MKNNLKKYIAGAAVLSISVFSALLNCISAQAFSEEDKIKSSDVIKIRQSIIGSVILTDDDYIRYDINEDGVINFKDFHAARALFLKDNELSELIGVVTTTDSSIIMPPGTVITDEDILPDVTTVPEETSVPATAPETTLTSPVTTTVQTTTVTTTIPPVPVTTTEATTTTVTTVTTPAVSYRPPSKKLDVNCIRQNPELPTGCEVTSLTMLLNHYGFGVSKLQLADIMPKFNFYYIGSELYGADFMTTFPGNPASGSGYGCYTPCMVTTAEKYFNLIGNDEYYLENLTGTDFDRLLSYVAADKPVLIWATISMIEPYYTTTWTTPEGNRVTWYANEHCLLLTGYDKNTGTVYVNDPLKGKTSYAMSVFKLRYNQMGRYAAVLSRKGENVKLPETEPPHNSSGSVHKVGDVVQYTGTVYYSSYGGSTAEVSGTFTITEIVEDESRPYRIRLGTAGWVPYNF